MQLKDLRNIKSDILSGIATAMFSIPEGMAYAKLAGVNPIYGLYSGMVATIAAALTTGTVLMISTITSAIAISTHSVLHLAGIESHNIANALFTLTFLIGVVMLTLGILRLGKIIDFVSNAVMTGFVVGASSLIIIGELNDLVGITKQGHNKIEEFIHWITQIHHWEPTTSAIGFGSLVFMILLQMIPKLKEVAALIVLLVFTLIVNLNDLHSVAVVGDIAKISGSLPGMVFPDFQLIPRLALGAVSVALIALTQGAGVSAAIRNPDGSVSGHSRDFIGQGLGNLFGSFFQSMGTGGSLSRTGISVGAGAKSRLSGIFTGIWLMMIILFVGPMFEHIPLACISGILCVIAAKIILKRRSDIMLMFTTSFEPGIVMLVTFLSALFIPLQWTIFLGAGLSLLFFAYTSATEIRLVQWVQDKAEYFRREKLPDKLESNQLIILDYDGNCFFGEVPAIRKLMPSIEDVHGAVLIWRMRGCEDAHSTFLKWLKQFVDDFHAEGNQFMLEGVEPHVMKQLKESGIIDTIGSKNVFLAEPGLFKSLDHAIKVAKQWIADTHS